MAEITGFHAHVYFDAAHEPQARALCEAAREKFGVTMGRMHAQPVGPHPTGSCQLTVSVEQFGSVIPWLALNRAGLTVFVHAETGDALKDHTDHAIWMGATPALKLDQFRNG